MISLYLFGAITSIIFNKKDRFCSITAFSFAALGSLAGLIFSLSVIFGSDFSLVISENYFIKFGFFVDKLSAFFIFIISISVFAVSIFSTGYVREYYGKKNTGQLCSLYNAFILTMFLVVSANNALIFLILWELMSILSYFLVIYEHEKPETRKAGFIYIVMTHIGTGFIILSFLILAGTSGSFDFETFKSAGQSMPPLLRDLAFLFAFIGFGTKAGIVPLHIWLPYAHPAAPANVSALMSGVMIKTAVFMIIRVSFDFLTINQMWWGYLVLAAGTITSILGILYAVVEQDMKKMLAFSSIENIGIVLVGLGASMIFFSGDMKVLSAAAAAAALYHLLNHSVFKGLLFMGAGSILFSTHEKNIEQLGGIIKKMPQTAALILAGVLSISAMPPFSGFISEWLTFQSLLSGFKLNDNLAMLVFSASAVVLALTGALAAYCFLKFFGIAFLALPRSENAAHAAEVNIPMLTGMGILAVFSLLLGLLPVRIIPVISSIAESFTGKGIYLPFSTGYPGIVSLPSLQHISVSTPVFVIMLILTALIPAYFLYGKKNSSQPVYETWGCGQPVSTSRNEYSAAAFSKPLQIWFRGLYRPAGEIEITYSSTYLKQSLKFESSIEQIFEKSLYNPVVDLIIGKSRKSKAIQTGSIHAYLGYIFGILVILFMFIITGGGE